MSSVFARACQIASTLQCSPLPSPIAVQTEPEHDFEVVPMKKLEGHTKIKTAIEITKFAPENGLNRCSKSVDAVAFDGHFGVHRVLLASVEPARQVKLKGRPMKLMYEYERSCQCKKKDAVRQVLPDRTAGWQFALDPMTGKVLGAYEHVVNERNEDKVALLQKVLALPLVSADLLLHDDACHFESFVNSRNCEGFENIKYYMVDCFHMRNHRCSKSVWTRKEKQRVKTVRTNMSESFNAWLRPLNFFLNHVRPHSHKFLGGRSYPLPQ